MHVMKGTFTRADARRYQEAKRRANADTLRLDGLDRELMRARRLLPRLSELNRQDLERWIDRVTGGGSGVMSADIGEANGMLEKFRYSLRLYERTAGNGNEGTPSADAAQDQDKQLPQ